MSNTQPDDETLAEYYALDEAIDQLEAALRDLEGGKQSSAMRGNKEHDAVDLAVSILTRKRDALGL